MITTKAWGFEDEIANREYCGKRIFVREQHRCSIHKHEKKDETFLVAEGLVWLETGEDKGKLNGTWLSENQRIHVAPGAWHRFTGMRDSLLIEFSTHHDDSDTVRDVVGGKMGDDEYRALYTEFIKQEKRSRLLTVTEAQVVADGLHAEGKTVGMCNGCFDLMHLGHAELLRQAKGRCEVLFVAVNNDESVKSLKGQSRPFVDELGRMGMVESNRFVDYVVEEEGKTCLDVVEAIKPQVYVTTTESGGKGPEAVEVIKQGGTVEVIEMVRGYNTTLIASIVSKIGPAKA